MTYEARRDDGTGDTLALSFHGTGGDADQFHGALRAWMPAAHVVSPRGDVMEGPMRRFFRRTGEGVYDMEDLTRRTDAMAAFIAAERARTGAARVVAMGYSNGANILASVILTQPGLVDRAALMHPLIPWTPDPQPGLAGLEILITAGRRDPIGPAPLTQALASHLDAQGADVRLHWHPGGHEIDSSEVDAVRSFLGARRDA
ncbi:MAG: alpha/beta hydrolase [Paracoccaceae bacterium]